MALIQQTLAAMLPVLTLIVIFTGIGLVLEWLKPAEPQQPVRRILFNLAYLPVYLISLALLAPMLTDWLPTTSVALLHLSWGQTFLGALAQTLLFALVYDFFYYWWHRAQHTWPALWAIHRLHHSERALNVTSSARHHWLEETLRPLVVLLPLALLLQLEPTQFSMIGTLFAAWPFFIHLNVRLSLGNAGRFIMGPQYHRVHHSIEPQHWNRNFGAFFPIWDYLFGTAYHPQPDEFPATGLTEHDGEPCASAREALTAPFAEWTRLWRDRRR